jgi:hypothetical protein
MPVSRDPSVLIGGTVYALTAILAIEPGREKLLRKRLKAWKPSPFSVLPSTHFARLVVLDKMAFEGPDRRRPAFPQQYLLFSATFDGATAEARDEYLRDMCHQVPEHVESVFGLCAGAPRPLRGNAAGFAEWIAANRIAPSSFFAHDPVANVQEIQRARARQAQVREFALRNVYQRPEVLRAAFDREFRR